ncbi:tetratricopeptide repeat protein [Mangrovibacterium marinum]|uniref:Uncharacterized protein n=1 Tax=Mangrovibacterium marinum TaxID=1639118 RepID=A0A2T5BYE8_9BACT|nr:tetratricopeptide repeat protein [Mangrovibacterium marinum]PTN07238.1 hypothetical protein C8N47_12023 [Mangrovibacterium marinum]
MKQFTILVFSTLLACFVGGWQLSAQQNPDVSKAQLANKYYNSRIYDKAAELYEQLYETTKSPHYFEFYLTCLIESDQLEVAEKEIKRALRKNDNPATLYVQWAVLLKKQGLPEEADQKLQQAIQSVKPSRNDYTRLANIFLSKGEYACAEQLYLKAPQVMPDENFNYELGRVYLYQRNYSRMFAVYLDLIRTDEKSLPRMESAVQSAFRLDVDHSLRKQLQATVLERMQREPEVTAYNRLLIWLFLSEKKYASALRQQIALDKRGLEEEPMIMQLARIAGQNQGYNDALKAYDYLLAKGKTSSYWYAAKQERMNLLYQQYTDGMPEALSAPELAGQFEAALADLGFEAGASRLILNYSQLLTFGLQQPDRSIDLLLRAMNMEQLEAFAKDELKTALADVYVFTGDVWEAIFLYSQLIEDNKMNELGDEVKLKKARLGYYMGEMSWAKAQLDVLKASTSKLIANDAMELSLFIGNNMNLDTTSIPLQLFAKADLLLFRHQPDAAWAMLDSLQQAYPFHSLQDDILYRKASIREQQGNWRDAALWLEKLVAEYPWDLLADDALLELGNVYRTKLNDPEKAKAYYLKLLEDHSGSVHVEQARKYFRELRGDFDQPSAAETTGDETSN